jgi:hypothetical protein
MNSKYHPLLAYRLVAYRLGAFRLGGLLLAAWVFAAMTLCGAETVVAWGEDAADENLARLEGMTDAEKTALLQKKRRFDDLPAAEQERLRAFHTELQADPRQAELKHVLERYSGWLRTLTPLERAELTSLPADKRLKKIGELLHEQDAQRFRMMAVGFFLSPKDLSVIQEWCDKFIDDHAQEVLDQIPADVFKNMTGRAMGPYVPERDRPFVASLYMIPVPESVNMPRPSREDELRLQSRISKEAQEILARAKDDKERSAIIQNWTWAAVRSRTRVNPSSDELDKFAQTLDEKERFRLENLPREWMYRELRWMYGQKRFGGDPGRLGRGGGKVRRWGEGPRDGPGPPPGGFMQGPFSPGPPPGGPPPNGPPPDDHSRNRGRADEDGTGKPRRPADFY